MANGDLYAELGVSRGASAAEVKAAYRKLARELHPDLNPGDDKAEERFKRVSYAHHVLSDPKRRKLYDEFGEDGLREGFDPEAARAQGRWRGGPAGGASGFDEFLRQARGTGRPGAGFGSLEDLFGAGGLEDLFGGAGGPAGRRGSERPEPAPQQADVFISFMEALQGTEQTLNLRDQTGERTIRVRIPAGVTDGGKVRLRGQGGMRAGGKRGDLLLNVRVSEHPFYTREGDDLHVDVPVTLGEAYRGESIKIPTPDGNVSMKIPKGLSGGTKLRLKGRGVKRKDGAAGDLYAHVQLQMPKERSEKLDALFKEIDEAYGEVSVRAELVDA